MDFVWITFGLRLDYVWITFGLFAQISHVVLPLKQIVYRIYPIQIQVMCRTEYNPLKS